MDCIPEEVSAVVRAAYGPGTADITWVHVSRTVTKGRPDDRFYIFTRTRMEVLPARGGAPEASVHYLHFREITAGNAADVMTIVTTLGTFSLLQCTPAATSHILSAVTSALRFVFPRLPLSQFFAIDEVLVSAKLAAELAAPPNKPARGPCDAFWTAYLFSCDFHGVQPRTLGVKEIIEEYHDTRCRTMTADDIGCFDTPDACAIVTALHHNTYFRSLVVRDIKLASPVLDSLSLLVLRSSSLQTLVASGVGARGDFFVHFSRCLELNPYSAVHSLDLSNNPLEDRGVVALAAALKSLPQGIRQLTLANCSFGVRGAVVLGKAISSNMHTPTTLQSLVLKDNLMGVEGVQSVLDIFTRNNVLNTLDVSGTSCVGEQVLMTLHGGFYEQLTYLGLANNKFTLKKTKDYKPPPTLTQVFQTAASLRTLDLAESKIPAEGLRAIFVGCAQNSLLSDVHVNLRGCECEAAAGSVLVDMLPKLACLHRLDLSSNDFTDEQLARVISSLAAGVQLRELVLDENLGKSKTRKYTVQALCAVLSDNSAQLWVLSLNRMRLKGDMLPLLAAIGTNTTLRSLFISGNQIGDTGASLLAAILHYNKTLACLEWDDNLTTSQGLREMAAALAVNISLRDMRLPFDDISQSLKSCPGEARQAVENLQTSLCANHSPARFALPMKLKVETQVHSHKRLTELLSQATRLSSAPEEDPAEVESCMQRVGNVSRLVEQLATKVHAISEQQKTALLTRLQSFAEDFVTHLTDELHNTINDLADLVAEAGPTSANQEIWHPLASEYEASCRELMETALVTSAGSHVVAFVQDQLQQAANRVAEFAISQATTVVQDIITGRNKAAIGRAGVRASVSVQSVSAGDPADGGAVPQQSPVSLSSEQGNAERNADTEDLNHFLAQLGITAEDAEGLVSGNHRVSFTIAQEADVVPFEPPVSFESPASNKADPSGFKHLQHHTKVRPQGAVGRRPPRRVRRAELAFDPVVEEVVEESKAAAAAAKTVVFKEDAEAETDSDASRSRFKWKNKKARKGATESATMEAASSTLAVASAEDKKRDKKQSWFGRLLSKSVPNSNEKLLLEPASTQDRVITEDFKEDGESGEMTPFEPLAGQEEDAEPEEQEQVAAHLPTSPPPSLADGSPIVNQRVSVLLPPAGKMPTLPAGMRNSVEGRSAGLDSLESGRLSPARSPPAGERLSCTHDGLKPPAKALPQPPGQGKPEPPDFTSKPVLIVVPRSPSYDESSKGEAVVMLTETVAPWPLCSLNLPPPPPLCAENPQPSSPEMMRMLPPPPLQDPSPFLSLEMDLPPPAVELDLPLPPLPASPAFEATGLVGSGDLDDQRSGLSVAATASLVAVAIAESKDSSAPPKKTKKPPPPPLRKKPVPAPQPSSCSIPEESKA